MNVTGGVGLPLNSRYMGTFQYTNMRSDASNLPFSSNPLVLAQPGIANPLFSAPNRETNTTLFNNVLNTQITSELNSTLKYRYYNYSAEANPAIIFTPRPPNPNSTTGFPDDDPAFRQPTSYTKQNADAEAGVEAAEMAKPGCELRLGTLGAASSETLQRPMRTQARCFLTPSGASRSYTRACNLVSVETMDTLTSTESILTNIG